VFSSRLADVCTWQMAFLGISWRAGCFEHISSLEYLPVAVTHGEASDDLAGKDLGINASHLANQGLAKLYLYNR
jgi:hypothetical protein